MWYQTSYLTYLRRLKTNKFEVYKKEKMKFIFLTAAVRCMPMGTDHHGEPIIGYTNTGYGQQTFDLSSQMGNAASIKSTE